MCPVQAHSKLNAEIDKRVILLDKKCMLSLDKYFVGELCPEMFLWVFPPHPSLAAPCRIPVTFVLLPETCRAAQSEYLVSLSAWIWRFLRYPARHIRSPAKAPLLRVLLSKVHVF